MSCKLKLVIASLSLSVLICGCDPFGEKDDRRRIQDEARAERQREADRLQSQAKAMTVYMEGRIRLAEAQFRTYDGRRLEIEKDVKAFADLIAADAAKNRETDVIRRRASLLLGLIGNPVVNDLARRYLKTDFTIYAGSFRSRFDEVMRDRSVYDAAVAKSEAIYEAKVKESNTWSRDTSEQRDREIERLLKEITTYEKQREKLRNNPRGPSRHSLVGGQSIERARYEEQVINESRIRELDYEIDKRRQQVDYLRSPRARQELQRKSLIDANTGQYDALRTKNNALLDIDRRLKPKVRITDVLDDFEGKTIEALRKAMQGELHDIESVCRQCESDVQTLKSYALSIPISDMTELRNLKVRAEAVGARSRH